MIQTARLLHQRFGKISWAQVLEPSVQLAIDGVPVTKQFVALLHQKHSDLQKQSTSFQALFSKVENNTQI